MSKGIRSYPVSERAKVAVRRMRNYDPKGNNGIGTLAAKDFQDKYKGNLSLVNNIVGEAELKAKGIEL